MDTLPEDIQNNIYKMKHELSFSDVMLELELEFYDMAYCLAEFIYGRRFTEEHVNNINKDLNATDVLEFRHNGRRVEETEACFNNLDFIPRLDYHNYIEYEREMLSQLGINYEERNYDSDNYDSGDLDSDNYDSDESSD